MRAADTYRGARRNAAREMARPPRQPGTPRQAYRWWSGVKPSGYVTQVKNHSMVDFWSRSVKSIRAFMRGGNHPRRS